MLGIEEIRIEDLREEFVRDFVFPMIRMNALYEGVYLLGTSIARPLIAKRLVEIAHETGADAIAHGATGKGNDQVRFELTAYALDPDIKVIAPWREWDFKSRSDLVDFAEQHQIPVAQGQARRGALLGRRQPSALLLGGQGAGGPVGRAAALRLPAHRRARGRPRQADLRRDRPSRPATPSPSTAKPMSPATLLTRLNALGRDNGIGRVDLVENRFVGMKSRGIYETPGGTILHVAHRAIESLTLDREAAHLKDELMPRYAELVYYGFWFAPEREMIQAMVDKSQAHVEGTVRLKLYKGNVIVVGRKSPLALFRRPRHLRGRPRRLRPEGRRRLHPPQRAEAEDAGRPRPQAAVTGARAGPPAGQKN